MKDKSYFTDITPIQSMQGDDPDDTAMLITMSQDADNFITSFQWCPAISEKYFGFGIGGIIAVFLYHFDSLINQADDWLWVVVGDLPSAYIVVDNATSPQNVMECYCELMEDWADHIMSNNSTEGCYPVKAIPTKENAELLLSRIEFIRREILE